MHHTVRTGVIAALGAAALALPATAAAATTTVYAGPPPNVKQVAIKLGAGGVGKFQPDINAFFNRRATIHVGDSVSFQLRGFHTIDLPPAGGPDLQLVLPSGGMISGVNDAAGNPFWFNGKVPNLGFNPMLHAPLGGTVYTGKNRLDTGLPAGPSASKPFVVKFTKAGTYRYFCDVHPGMIGYVTVKPKHARIPSAAQAAVAELKQLTGAIKDAVKLVKVKTPANTVDLGHAGPGGVELFSMFPAALTVSRGTVVTFRITARSREIHTATFGPASELKAVVNAFRSGMFAPGGFPSDPTQPIQQSATSHGDGFANTGIVDQDPSTPNPVSSTIQFNSPGTYPFICVIHPFMHGTIIVK